MLLGSHNTMTYLKPKKWWMHLGRFMAKCQNLDYRKQYECGVKWFDFRLSFDKYGNVQFSHGLVDYTGVNVYDVFQYISSKPDVSCRIILEKGNAEDELRFIEYIRHLLTVYPTIRVTQVAVKNVWRNMVDCTINIGRDMIDSYASCNGSYPEYQKLPGILRSKSWSGLLIDDLWPWIYAKFHNKRTLEKYKDKDVLLLLDFINQDMGQYLK